MRFALRTLGMFTGIFASVVALVVDTLYSLIHVLARMSGVTDDASHFWWGLLVTLIGFVGALLSVPSPVIASIMMLGAGIAFFWIAGWWAIFASLFFFIGAALVFLDRSRATSARSAMS